jgi:GNAT superfamily N-acetyltransferase
MSDRRIADRVADGMVASWRARVSSIAGHVLEEHDGVVVALSGLPDPELSVAIFEREPSDPLAALGRAERAFQARGGALGVVHERGRQPTVDRAIAGRGVTLVVSRPAMAIAVDRVEPPRAIEGFEVRRASSSADLAAMARIETASFGTAPEVAIRLLGRGALERPDVRLYVGVAEGEAVAMSYVHLHERALGVFGVATVPGARRRGFGAAITATAILDARSEADLAWLQPSEMGMPLYGRMGFEPIAEWQVWVRA